MYKVNTFYGVTHQYIVSWEEWELDPSFLKFQRTRKDDFVIVPKNQIKYIAE